MIQDLNTNLKSSKDTGYFKYHDTTFMIISSSNFCVIRSSSLWFEKELKMAVVTEIPGIDFSCSVAGFGLIEGAGESRGWKL